LKHSPTWEKKFKNQMEVLTKLLSNILILRVESHVKSQIFEMWYFDKSVIYIYISIMILVITYWKYSSKSGTFSLCFHQNHLHDCTKWQKFTPKRTPVLAGNWVVTQFHPIVCWMVLLHLGRFKVGYLKT
jgi:hypothetical protein